MQDLSFRTLKVEKMQNRRQTCQVSFADQHQNVIQSLYRQRIEGPERTVVIPLSSL